VPASASDLPTTRATIAPPSDSWPQLFTELASADLQTRESARVQFMRLTRDDLPALRGLVTRSRPLLPAQAAALHEIVQEIYLAGEKYPTAAQPFADDPEVRRQLQLLGATQQQAQQIVESMQAIATGDDTAQRAIEKATAQLMQQRRQDGQQIQRAMQQLQQQANSQATAPQFGFLGIWMDELQQVDQVPENDLHRPMGVIVADRIPGFCAARNLINGDIILGLASPFTPFHGMDDLKGAVGGSPPGTVVSLLVLRRGQVMRVTLTLDAKPSGTLLLDAGISFRAERQKKFDAYWQATFKPLLVQQLG
jgi:hypothetical protein